MKDSSRPANRFDSWRRRAMLLGLLVVVLAAAALFGRGGASWWARRQAEQHLARGALGPAQRLLAWAASIRPGDWRTALAQAACLRELGDQEAWRKAVDSARERGVAGQPLRLEENLGAMRFGEMQQVSRSSYEALVAEGAAPRAAQAAVVHALLAQGSREARDEAFRLVDVVQPKESGAAEAAYLRGVCWSAADDRNKAQHNFAAALKLQPHYEPARAALGRSLEEQYRLAEALPHYVTVLQAAPDRESARLDLARVLRKLNRLDDARRVLQPLTGMANVSAAVSLEAGEVAYESGDYAAAGEWFKRSDLEGPHVAESLRSAASTFAYQGDFTRSQQLFARIDDAQGLSRQMSELRRRMQIDPGDNSAAQELKRLAEATASGTFAASVANSGPTASPLFAQHCAACHGADGGGSGAASRYLYPRPRNLRADMFRLVSTQSLIPSTNDIELVIRQGIPGTSMPAFDKLPESVRIQLAQDVQRLYRSRYRGENAQEAGASLVVPALGEATAEAMSRGRSLFQRSGCQQCHGTDGTGAEAPAMFDDAGRPTVPRDLMYEAMKGGPSVESLYFRIRLGMPGTPHPAAASLATQELIDLVHYCRSLAKQPPRPTTNYNRSLRAVGAR